MEFRVLGPLEASDGVTSLALGPPKQRALLSRLLLDINRPVAVDRLIEDLWGETAPASAPKMVQIHVSQLRKILPADALRTRPPGYLIEADPETLDLTRFTRLHEDGRGAMATGDAIRASALLGEALALWRGPALAEFSEPFACVEGPRLEELRLACLEQRFDADLALGRHADVAGEVRALVDRHPLREAPRGQLMLALYRAGRQAEALDAYDRFRRMLDDELGIEPAEPLKQLQLRILTQDPDLTLPPRRAAQRVTTTARPIVTLMFTDLAGSTELLGRLGDDAAVELLRRHFALLRDALAAHGGEEVKNLGDGLMGVFLSAIDAVRCAIAMQQAVSGEGATGLRIGLHAGEPAREGDDYFGTPVVIARRLCDRAAGGQVLTSDLVGGLIGSRGDIDLRPVGHVSLEGLAEPVTAFEVPWDPAAGHGRYAVGQRRAPGRADLPPAVADADHTAFVGREGDLDRLGRAWARAGAGRLQVALIGGEPGVGKTRLAGQFARAAHAQGATVLFGRCDEDLGIPYQPFAEALRSGVAGASGVSLADLELGRLLPETSSARAAPPTDPAAQRVRLFDAVATALARLARGTALVAILDDLHWADRPTLLLLRYLVRSPTTPPLLLVGTYRDTELSREHPLSETLADLRRGVPVERISLKGLPSGDLAAMLAAIAGREPPVAFVRAIHHETEGNPFFAEEVFRDLTESGATNAADGRWTVAQMSIPEGVKETIAGRLARLPAGGEAELARAAVLGRVWDYQVALAMDPERDDELMQCVEAALAARLIVEADGGRSPAYSFSHALVRETLYEELSLPRRQRLHLRAAQAIERVHAGALDAQAASLALHYRLAGTVADPEVTLRWLLRAGELAAAQLAWEDAAGHWDAAAGLMPEAGVADADRVSLLERLGDLKYAANFDLVEGTAQLEEALAHHDRAGDARRAARLRSRIGRNLTTFHGPVQDVARGRALLEAAEVVIREEGDRVPLASVYIGLATAACWANDVPELVRTAERAMAVADGVGHEVLWANAAVLYANGMTWAGRGEEADTHFEAAWEIGDRLNHPWVPFLAAWCRLGDLCWRGEVAAGRRLCERELAKPRTLQAPGQREYLENLLAWTAALAGELGLARELVERSSPDVAPPFAAGLMQLLAGDPRTVAGTLERWRDACVQRGNAWTAMVFEHDIAQAQWALGDPAVDATYRRITAAATASGGGLFELMYRCQYTRRLVELRRTAEARRELDRCREVFASGNRWGAREGDLALAEATVAAAEGEDAEGPFTLAGDIYSRFGVVWDQAEAFEQRGVSLSPRDPRGAAAMLDRAIELYDRHGADTLWRERALRRRASLEPAER